MDNLKLIIKILEKIFENKLVFAEVVGYEKLNLMVNSLKLE